MEVIERNYSIHEIEEWTKKQQDRIRREQASSPGLSEIILTVEPGRKNARIVKNTYGHRSVWCFIELSTGNILKASGFKAPAKGRRGHISEERSWDWAGGDWYR